MLIYTLMIHVSASFWFEPIACVNPNYFGCWMVKILLNPNVRMGNLKYLGFLNVLNQCDKIIFKITNITMIYYNYGMSIKQISCCQ